VILLGIDSKLKGITHDSVKFKTETSDAQMLEEGQSYTAADL
jgi:hypothetical protein